MTRIPTNGIPVISIRGRSIAETWETSMLEVYYNGCDIQTQYDKPDDPPSKDCTMVMTIEEPLREPMIHRCFPGSLDHLKQYVNEVLYGTQDHHIVNVEESKKTGKLYYTYHQRLFDYMDFASPFCTSQLFDQIKIMCIQLAETPYTRRAQAVTWKVWEDNNTNDPPCLQSIWCRMTPADEKIDIPKWLLSMNVRIRSNDAYRAAFMNIFAFVQLQKFIAEAVSQMRGEPVIVGRYCHMADSYHIYGSTMKDFEQRFFSAMKSRTFSERTWNSSILKKAQ